jgi:hypothetical protein
MKIPDKEIPFYIIPSKHILYAESKGVIAPVKFIPPEEIVPSIDNGQSVYQDEISRTYCRFPRWFNPTLPLVFIPGEVFYRSISNHQNTVPQVRDTSFN